LPAIGNAKQKAKIKVALMEMHNLAGAIHQYETEYSRMPGSKDALAAAAPDFTFGTANVVGNYPYAILNYGSGKQSYQTNNAEIMFILRDINNPLNPRQVPFFSAKDSGSYTLGGVDPSGVFRDPWGNPYMITIDMDGSNRTSDGMYRLQMVSQKNGSEGFFGLSNVKDNAGSGDNFEVNQPVMIWSFGPDGQANPKVPANQDVNKDNVLSWQ
jgi:hypothetical protein